MTNKTYIILLNYNGWKDTIECLESVLKNDYENYQIIVVDNDSPNNSMEYIINWADGKQEVVYDENSQLKYLSQPSESKPLDYVVYTKEEALNGGDREKESKLNNRIIFIQAGKNGGFAAGNNIGIKYVKKKGDSTILLLNNDTVIDRNFIKNMMSKINNKLNQVIVPKSLSYLNNNEIDSEGFGYINLFSGASSHKKKKVSFKYAVGSCMLINSSNSALLCMDEDVFLYFDDAMYSKKLENEGYKLEYYPECKIYHKISSSTSLNPRIEEIKLTSMIVFFKKYYSKYLFFLIPIRIIYYLSKLRFRMIYLTINNLCKSK